MGYKGIETEEQKDALLRFPFAKLDTWLEQNFDFSGDKAKSAISQLKQHDPVLFETINHDWWLEHEKAYLLKASPAFAFSGAILCWLYLKEKAAKSGKTFPSFTALGKKPEPKVNTDEERQRVAQKMEADDPKLVRSLGGIVFILRAMEWETYKGNNDPVVPNGAFVSEGALKCYATFCQLVAP